MKDKNYDDFFDDEAEGRAPEDALMAMIDKHDTPQQESYDIGSTVKGTLLSVGSEYAFIDIGAKNEAMMNKAELADKNGEIAAKPDDTIEAYVVSNSNNEIMLSKSLGGHKATMAELSKAHKSQVPVRGKVTGVNKGGFNINILGHRAFCPISHIDSKYVENPNNYLSQTFSFVITRLSDGGRTIVVSRLPIFDKEIESRINELSQLAGQKQVIKGAITRIADFGLFVDIGGIEGLVHISEVSWERAENLSETFSVGQAVECMVLKVEQRQPYRESKISLSIKQVLADPWENLSQRLKPGESVDGTITRLANFGAFVQLVPGVEGLIHVSEMSWAGRVQHPRDVVQEGQQVRVTILAVDEEKRSVSCSLKDVNDDPWNNAHEKYAVGSTLAGTVESKTRYGFFVKLADGVTGLLVYNNISADKKDRVKVGDAIDVGVESVDTERRRISLTYGVQAKQQTEQEAKQYLEQQKQAGPSASSEFGEKLKAALKGK